MAPSLSLRAHPEPLSVVRLSSDAPPPDWVFAGPGIAACVRRGDELGIVCATDRVPADATAEPGWVALEVDGPLDFTLTGILLAIAAPLADAEISIYALSTYDTDVVLVRAAALDDAVNALAAAGHVVSRVS
jgi:hypothetical protein